MHSWPLSILPGDMPVRMLEHVIARVDFLLEREQVRRRASEAVNDR